MSRIFNCFGCGFYGEVNTSMYCQACAISQNQNRIDSDNRRRLGRDRRYEERLQMEDRRETYGGLLPNGMVSNTRKNRARDDWQYTEPSAKQWAKFSAHSKIVAAEEARVRAAKNTKDGIFLIMSLMFLAAPVVYMFMNWHWLGASLGSVFSLLISAPIVGWFNDTFNQE